MTPFAPAAVFALFLWWFSTGVLLYVDHLPHRTFPRSILVATTLALGSIYGLYVSSQVTTVVGAYAGFVCAIMVWAWHEMTFLMGWVTGPRKQPCPPSATGWRRFWYATATIIHHELALFGTAVFVIALTWDAPNQVGTATFLVLWIMRLSAKFNIFLGVSHLTTAFVPDHLNYMLSYFRWAPFNPLMPVSVVFGSIGVILLTTHGLSSQVAPFDAAAVGLVAMILALAVLEHVLLVLPIRDAALWSWAHRPSQ